jgi:hypothetical protein
VDHSKLEIDKEIDFLTERLENFVIKSKVIGQYIKDLHQHCTNIEVGEGLRQMVQETILQKLQGCDDFLYAFDEKMMNLKTINEVIFKTVEETYENKAADKVLEGSRLEITQESSIMTF